MTIIACERGTVAAEHNDRAAPGELLHNTRGETGFGNGEQLALTGRAIPRSLLLAEKRGEQGTGAFQKRAHFQHVTAGVYFNEPRREDQ